MLVLVSFEGFNKSMDILHECVVICNTHVHEVQFIVLKCVIDMDSESEAKTTTCWRT